MGKYESISNFLVQLEKDIISLSFKEMNEILNDELPPSSYKYREWWANSRSHTQAHSWLDAGWIVDEVILGKLVKFIRKS